MDAETLTHRLRGGHLAMPERIRRGLWPHPPLRHAEVVGHLAGLIENHPWFPGSIEEMGLDLPDIEGQMTVENRGNRQFVCHFADHCRHVQRRFRSSRGAARFHARRALHLPGRLDGWTVVRRRSAARRAARKEGPVGIKVNVKWKFTVNGKEYGSVAEMPAAVREACQRARRGGQAVPPGAPGPIAPGSSSARKLVIGGAILASLAIIYFLLRG